MAQRIACSQCGESNYESSPACWACGAPLKGPRTAAPEPLAEAPPDQAAAPPPEPESAPIPEPPPAPEPAAPEADPPGESEAARSPKPAEIEAQALRDREYVTPPVETDERPGSLGEWILYITQGAAAMLSGFKESMDEYDRRRGRVSGAVSSYGCLLTTFTIILLLGLLTWLFSYLV